MKADLLIDRNLVIQDGKYVAFIKVFRVPISKKFPEGIKAKFLLQDVEKKCARLLVDNHAPFGFHLHSRLPDDSDYREPLNVRDHDEALDVFFEEMWKVVRNEE